MEYRAIDVLSVMYDMIMRVASISFLLAAGYDRTPTIDQLKEEDAMKRGCVLVGTAVVLGFLTVTGNVAAVNCSWQPTSGTNRWFIIGNWDNGVPSIADNAFIDKLGVCSIDGVGAACNDLIVGYAAPDTGLRRVVVETGASLAAANRGIVGYTSKSHGYMDIRGTVDATNGFYIAGGKGGEANVAGSVVINGGTLTEYKTSGYLSVGADGDGSLTVNSGTVRCIGSLSVAGGTSPSSVGRVAVNGGMVVATNALGIISGYQGQLIFIGTQGLGGTYVQNGGTTMVGRINMTATAPSAVIVSNGVLQCVGSDASHRVTANGAGNRMVVAGGALVVSNATSVGVMEAINGGVIELRDGTFEVSGDGDFLALETNGILRVVGPLCGITVGFLKNYQVNDESAIQELILTQDGGHISRIRCTPQAPGQSANWRQTALAGTLRVGLDGGAMLLSKNVLPYIWTESTFPARTYALDLWNVTETANPAPENRGIQKEITLKGGLGTLSLSTRSLAFANTAHGYVNVDDLGSCTLQELPITLSLTPAAKSVADIVQDLQRAGYTNTIRIGDGTVIVNIPVESLPSGRGYFAWDFRAFDGTVNATVQAVDIQFAPRGTVVIVR